VLFSFPPFFRCGFLTLFSLLSDNIVFSATLLLPQHGVVVVELEEVGSKRIRIRSWALYRQQEAQASSFGFLGSECVFLCVFWWELVGGFHILVRTRARKTRNSSCSI
jgi:hypothetical protein